MSRLPSTAGILILTAAVCPALLLEPAAAPQPPPRKPGKNEESIIRVDVELVNIFFSVRNKRGAFVKDLPKDDFSVYEDGKEQEIRAFSRETDLPLTIGLLVDVSKSQETLIEAEKRAASQFFRKLLRPKDLAFLISFGSEAELLQDLTGSPRLLDRGLEGLRLSTSVGGLHPGPVPTANKPKGTILYDAVYMAAKDVLAREVGRKVIVLITDGMDFGSHYSLKDAIGAAHKSDAIIYGIYYVDQSAYGGFGASDGDLKRMCEETGGRVFHAGRKTTLDDIFNQIQEEMRSQYALGYFSSNPARDGGFRRVEIKPKEKDLKVQARKGYFAAGAGKPR
jgi:VWFA-related protein